MTQHVGLVDLDEPLLGAALPRGDPASVTAYATELDHTAGRLLALAHGAARLLPVAGWSGVAAAAADRRLLDSAAGIGAVRSRLFRAADALREFAATLTTALDLAAEAGALLAAARRLQDAADARDVSLALGRTTGQWAGPDDDGRFTEPTATRLLHQAREVAREARRVADRAVRALVDELTALSGREVVRDGGSWHTVADLAGLVPGWGEPVDLANAALHARDGRWGDAAVSAAAAVPGPLGWLAGGSRAGRAIDDVGEVARVVDDGPRSRAASAFAALPDAGRRRHVRLLPDDAAVDEFFWQVCTPLGWTNTRQVDGGWITTTHLPDGSRIVHRDWSTSGGHTIELHGMTDVEVTQVHRAGGGSTDAR